MIKAQKHTLEWQLAQGKVTALTRELDFLIDVFYQIINMATFVAGFGSLGIGVDMLEVYEQQTNAGEPEWCKWIGRACVYLSSVTLFLSLWVVCVVLSVVPNARRWALEGPIESVEDAVRRLKEKLSQVINVFTTSLFTFILERVANCALFDNTLIITPAMFLTGAVTLGLITYEWRSAVRTYTHTPEKAFERRAFPQRPPELYRELGRMKRMSTVLGNRPFGPSILNADGAIAQPPAKAHTDSALSLCDSVASAGAGPSKAERGHHSWVDVTRVTGGKERGYTRRYSSLESGIVTLYGSYEDYILDVPAHSLQLPLAEYKLAELIDEREARLGQFELVPCAPPSHTPGHAPHADRHTYRFRPENAKAGFKWISALRAAQLALASDEPRPPAPPQPSQPLQSPQPRGPCGGGGGGRSSCGSAGAAPATTAAMH
ncbi:hypothetical protein KFE25_013581 [Diacronema lutheri]|uniref:PH domain-containing protein n=2 Tax=Diacronema lutheri TaxID=2081491 RepID=A0A8J5XIZ3_DIALT|nr:hypothetical protein KFE25_013581 [Diacronema lutheri]